MKENRHSRIQGALNEFLDRLKALKYSPRSIDIYSRAIRDFAGRIPKDPGSITTRDLEAYRSHLLERGFAVSSLTVYFQAIRLFLKDLEERQMIFVNPAAELGGIKKGRRLQPVPTEEEMRIFLEQPDEITIPGIRDRALFETAYSTGARRQELLGMTVGCLSLEEGKARIMGKGSRERVVPVGEEAIRRLKAWLEARRRLENESSGNALWLAMNGRPMEVCTLQQILRRRRNAPGIVTKIGLHSIRRACATHMLRRGANPLAIQLLLGHASAKHLSQYLKVTGMDIKKAHQESRVGQ